VKAKGLLKAKGAQVEEIELPEEFEKISRWHANVLVGEGRTSFLGSEVFRLLLFQTWGPEYLDDGEYADEK
jgi:hypothetical protein